MSGKNKRRRLEEEAEDEEDGPPTSPKTVLKLPEGMRSALGGRKYCSEDELTREVMLQYLKSKGDIKEVRLVEVTVQTMTGHSFGVALEAGAGAQVHVLKSEIKEAQGFPVERQDLFVLSADTKSKGKAGGQGSAEPLAEDFVIEVDCTVALCVAVVQDVIIMGLAPEVYRSIYMGVYEWQEEHSGGKRPVYKMQDDDDVYLYYCDSTGQWLVSSKESMLGRKPQGCMVVEDKALTPESITATWSRDNGTDWVKQSEIRVLPATTDNVRQLEQQREKVEQRAKQQAEERGNITMGGLAAGHVHFTLMGVYELMDAKEKWVNRRAVYKKAGSNQYLYFSKRGNWMTGNKESVDRGGGGWLETPLSCAITPDDVPADTAWKAFTATGWVAVPEVHARTCS